MRSRSAKRLCTLTLVAAPAALLGGLPVVRSIVRTVAAAEPDEEFRTGVKAFEEGRFEDAEKAFREVLKSRPSDEQARLYRDEAGYQFWVQMLAKGGNLATLAKRLLTSAESGAKRERQDDAKMQAVLDRFFSDDFMKQMEAQEEIIAVHGHYIVPKLVEALGERREDDKRVRVIGLLSRLGEEGVLALLQCLKGQEPLLRQNACICLGNIRDWRALPQLKKVAEKDADSHVKSEADIAIKKITNDSKSTAEMFAIVADRFYREHPLVMINRFKEWVSWHWKDEKLSFKDELRPIWNDKVAEEYCYEGLGYAPSDENLWAILVSSYAEEWTKLDEITRVAQQKKDKGVEIDEAEVAKLNAEKTGSKKKLLALAAGAGGYPRIFRALRKSLEDGTPQVGVTLIELLQQLHVTSDMLPGSGAVTIEQKPMAGTEPVEKPAPTPAPIDNGAGNMGGGDSGGGTATPAPSNSPAPESTPANSPSPETTPTPAPSSSPEATPSSTPAPEPSTSPSGDQPNKPRPRRVSMNNAPAPTPSRGTKRLYADADTPAGGTPASNAGSSGGGAVGDSLCAALVYHDKRIRYAAAICLANVNPSRPFANQDKVIDNLIDALSESGQRVVLVVERDLDLRNRIVGLLRESGYMVFATESGLDGLNRAKSFPAEDLVIVSSELNKDGTGGDPVEFQFIQELREDYRTKTLPAMILTPSGRVGDMQKLVDDKTAADVITPDVDRNTLDAKIKKIFEGDDYKRDEKARNDDVSKRAALAIANVPQDHTVLQIERCGPALAGCLGPSRPDDVKIAAMKAIAAIGPKVRGATLDALTLVFKDKNNTVDVREAAANAIGEIVKGQAFSGDGFKALKAAFAEDEERIWKAAGFALGKANLTGDQQREVAEEHRIE